MFGSEKWKLSGNDAFVLNLPPTPQKLMEDLGNT
jgi:hypothetical protein